eukprot:TRINITY_DN39520_c0_g1_i5.p2 TRINITY_DN39520_c0_g1~~TRINITY_DN39520_c0_g1_i5.p2  ORF type:complete len:122 (-),score=26.35 TRINITY_DN39520_c0_g1_i5:143-508(-)
MDAPVRRFLADEAAHLGAVLVLRLGRQGGDGVAHRVDEELLAEGKTHRQGVEEGGGECIAAAPVAGKRGLEIDQKAADDEFGAHEDNPRESEWWWQGVWYRCVPQCLHGASGCLVLSSTSA